MTADSSVCISFRGWVARSPWLSGALGLAAIVALAWSGGPAQAQRPKLGNDEQLMVNRAISEGVRYLVARQKANNPQDGRFPGPGHPVGVTALAGLALLESGLKPNDESIRAAGQFIRGQARELKDTYDLSLAILFLDRLGVSKDKALIQMFALRLIGGQTTSGGWSYTCPIFTPRDQNELLRVLRRLEQLEKGEPPLGIAGGNGKDQMPPIAAGGGAGAKNDGKGPTAGSTAKSETMSLARLPRPGMCIKSADDSGAPAVAAIRPDGDAKEPGAPPPPGAQPARKPGGRVVVAGELGFLPVLQDRENLGERTVRGANPDAPLADPKGRTDNSNTQFAILAMWTAQRYEVPVRRTLELIVKRFRESQNADGGWVYSYAKGGAGDSTPAMTCSGLAGLAIGFGLTDAKKAATKADEQLVKRAFRCLMKFVGEPSEKFDKRVPLVENSNLYYLWSIERVAVMYNLPTLGNKDWYRWGAEILLTNQAQAGLHLGAWVDGGNATLADPVVNTSFALLFLRGANLTSDLTDRLPINAEDLNKELAGETSPALRTPVKEPGKNDSNPLGSVGTKEGERPIDGILPETKPEATDPKPAPQPVQAPSTTPAAAVAEKKEESNAGMIAIFAVVAVVVIAGVGAAIYFATRGAKKTDDEDDDKPRRAQKGRRTAPDDDEEEQKPRPRRTPSNGRGAGKKPTRARYDDDDDD